jgi:hypothetical protein
MRLLTTHLHFSTGPTAECVRWAKPMEDPVLRLFLRWDKLEAGREVGAGK